MQLRILPLLTIIIFSVVWSFAFSVPTTLAQGFEDDYGDMDEFMQEDDGFSNDSGFSEDGFLADPGLDGSLDDSFDAPAGDGFMDDDEFGLDTESQLQLSELAQRELIVVERQQATANIGYGAGTGLMLGTWFAFITQESSTRDQFRTIGSGSVLGALVGMMLGTRSLWNPSAPRPTANHQNSWNVQPLALKHGVGIAYRLSF
jgi:hypothetical protein